MSVPVRTGTRETTDRTLMPGLRRFARSAACVFALVLGVPAAAQAALTVEPITWNIIGLDSNSPTTGPQHFPVGARVCSDVATTNVTVNFVFESANAFINLRPGSLSTLNFAAIPMGDCVDAYFEVEVTKNASAYDTTRRYRIEATDMTGTYSSPTPRELYVEHLVSQSRNAITNIRYGTTPMNLQTVGPGGTLALVVGQTYIIELSGGTATQGYEQFEAFINFSNAVFQVLSVNTTYSADTSIYVDNPNDKLYADACLWDNDPNSPTYRACVGVPGKAGGSNVVTTYTVRIVSGGGTNQTLNTLLYDFSGSSYHYNADFSAGARIAAIIDPNAATIAKSFNPNPAPVNGVSALTITLGNPNGAPLDGYAFVDNLPAGMTIATPSGATASGCGTPTLSAPAGGTTITFSNGTVAAMGTCVVKVNVTTTATGTYVNTTNNLFVAGVDTGKTATDTLTVNNAPPPGTGVCGTALATWRFPIGFNTMSPAPSAGTGTANAGAGLTATNSTTTLTTGDGTHSWRSNGGIAVGAPENTANNDYFEFAVNTTGLTSVQMNFNAQRTNNGPRGYALYVGTAAAPPGTFVTRNDAILPAASATVAVSNTVGGGLINPTGTTFFRVFFYNSNNDNPGSDVLLDDVVLTGCTAGTPPAIAKAFTPNPIAVNGVSTLTFTLTNPNAAPLTNAAFTDTLPAGTQVAATPAAATTCGGTWAPAAGATSLTFSGGTIPTSGSCTVSVNVTATTAGPHQNVSGFLSTTETGTSTGSVATATLDAVAPPAIDKQFSPNPILPGATSTLTFSITNPNSSFALSGVAFTDTFPATMTVAAVPNATTNSCGAPTFAPAAGAGSVTFSGGTIAAGGVCTVSVNVTAPAAGSYANTSGNVSHVINAQTVNGNTASDTLVVVPPSPDIGLLKEVGPTATGPWSPSLAVNLPGNVFYRFTIENLGDVALSPVTLTDNTVDTSSCVPPAMLPAPVAANENHIFQCVVGPVTAVAGSTTNTATASGTGGGSTVTDTDSAVYATTGLTLDKTAAQASFMAAGETLNYSYLVQNSGFAVLAGPVTVTDDKATVTCPALTTVGDLDAFFDPGESITCAATYVTTAADVTAAGVTNTASASAGGATSNTDQVTVPLGTAADISVVKTLTTMGPYLPGQSVTYTILVANAGPSTATNIQVTDTPTNLSITSVSGACVALPCTIASLASGANTTINVTATIVAPGAFDNSTTVDADEPDPDTTDNTDNTGNGGTTGASADVSITKTLDTMGPYVVGQTITYTLTVANGGPSTATNIAVTDTPTNLTITNVSGACVSFTPCTIASLAVGASATITVTATINAAGPFDNVATANGAEFDPNLTNNTDDAGNNGNAAPSADVSVVKTLTTAGPYTVGQSIQYTLLVANAGPSPATGVLVTDAPTNLTITLVSGGGCTMLPCTVGNLAVGANVTITVTATINAAGAFDNSATVTATENDPNPGNNTDNTGNGGNAAASADVSITKTLNTAGPYTVGQTIQYTLVVANAGPSPATNIVVTDTPTNLTITMVGGSGCASFACTIPALAVGANTSITVTATINAAGAFDNVATANGAEPDPDPSDNTDDTGNGGNAAASADVSIVKTLTTAGPYVAGQSVTYTLLVANAGPSPATNIVVADTPTNLAITMVAGSGCTMLPCTIPALAVGANTTITETATIVAPGAFDNVATANGTEPDPVPANNTDDAGNNGTATALADVSIVKTLVTAGPYTVGQTVMFTLVVGNAGPSTATSVVVTDTPTNLTITNVSGSGCTMFPCTIASLASGASTTINVTATIPAAGAFDNVATANGAEPDPDSSNNTDDTGNGGTATVAATPTLNVAKSATPNPFVVGQSGTYTITVTNSGSVATAGDIVVNDTLPTGITLLNAAGTSWSCAGTSALLCTFTGTLAATGGSTTLTLTVAVAPSATALDNSATAQGGGDPGCPAAGRCTGTVTGGVTPVIDVSLVKTLVTSGPYVAGQTITYTLDVANAGPSTATSIVVTDTPTNLTITNVTGAGCTALPCTIPSLAAGASVTITLTATIDAVGAFDNSATATPAETDPTPPNNTDSVGNNGVAGAPGTPQLSVTKSASPQVFVPGQPATYTITVANTGALATTAPITVADSLPTGITLVNATGTSWSCAGTTVLTCTFSGTVAAGANTVLTLNVAVSTSAVSGTNSATASGGGDATCPAAARCTGVVAVPIAAVGIPTLGAWGLALMVLALGMVGFVALRRRDAGAA